MENEQLSPMCKEVLKVLEDNGVEVTEICHGRIKEKEFKEFEHSLQAYIHAKKSPQALRMFQKIYELEKYRNPMLVKKGRGPVLRVFDKGKEQEPMLAIYFPRVLWDSWEQLSNEWKAVLNELKK